MNKKIILGATHSVIEPLGLLYLSSIARQEGYEPKIVMAKHGFDEFDKTLKEYKPAMLCFSTYTGNHNHVFDYLDQVRRRDENIKIVVGGPHATFFPQDSKIHSDFVVLSEGFNAFRKILQGKVRPGIIPLIEREKFPESDRKDFYKDHAEYNDSPIKSLIASTGCPWACTYCYNSSTIDSLENVLNETQKEEMRFALRGTRLFPRSIRSVDEVIEEVKNIMSVSPTKMIYFQDDVFGVSSEWTREFSKKYKPLGIPFHAQMRFENANPYKETCRERLSLLREAGCTGLTFAIEAADPIIRDEVLNRQMPDTLIYESLTYLSGLGYKVRTEQMLSLPYGATSKPTKINLEADLNILALNVKLKKETSLPTMAWASIFAPYRGTKIGDYCNKHGFYSGGNNDVPETFFQRSVLKFPREYVGPSLDAKSDKWMSEEELKEYKDRVILLRDLFSYFSMIPNGHKLAERFIKGKDYSYACLSKETRHHLYNSCLYDLENNNE